MVHRRSADPALRLADRDEHGSLPKKAPFGFSYVKRCRGFSPDFEVDFARRTMIRTFLVSHMAPVAQEDRARDS